MDGIIHTISDSRIINGIIPYLYMGYTPDKTKLSFSRAVWKMIKQWRFRSRKSIELDARFPWKFPQNLHLSHEISH
jgi:hypothetical protein